MLLEPNAEIIYESALLSEIITGIYIFAILILLLAIIELRPSLRVSPIPIEGAPLITSGIYKWIRHPMYVSVMMFGAGLALNNLNWITILIWVVLLITLISKAGFEDSLLRTIHTSAFEYQKRKNKGAK